MLADLKDEILEAAPTRCDRSAEIMETVKGTILELAIKNMWLGETAPQAIKTALAELGYYSAVVTIKFNETSFLMRFKVVVDDVVIEGHLEP